MPTALIIHQLGTGGVAPAPVVPALAGLGGVRRRRFIPELSIEEAAVALITIIRRRRNR
jgi:hypothetical protein